MSSKRQSAFAVIGFFVAPLVSAIEMAATTPLAEGSLFAALGLVPIFYVFAFLASGLLGFPAFLTLQRFRLVRWWSASLAGAAVGAIVAFVVVLPSALPFKTMSYFMAVGASSGLSFWAIWRVGAPGPNSFFNRTNDGAA